MQKIIRIDSRFHGPPNSGNGGYVSGLTATHIPGPAEVILRRPPPLDKSLTLESGSDGSFRLVDEGQIIAEARPTDFEIEIPNPPSFSKAGKAASGYVGFEYHYFPTCFVCGPNRAEGHGLRIFAGEVSGGKLVAAPWIPGKELAGKNGFVKPIYLWAALDCPGAFAFGRDDKPLVLGTLAVKIKDTLVPGERCVVTGWPRGQEGRKFYSGTAIFGEDGRLIAVGWAIWIELDQDSEILASRKNIQK